MLRSYRRAVRPWRAYPGRTDRASSRGLNFPGRCWVALRFVALTAAPKPFLRLQTNVRAECGGLYSVVFSDKALVERLDAVGLASLLIPIRGGAHEFRENLPPSLFDHGCQDTGKPPAFASGGFISGDGASAAGR